VLALVDEAHVATALGAIIRKGRSEMKAYRSDGLSGVFPFFLLYSTLAIEKEMGSGLQSHIGLKLNEQGNGNVRAKQARGGITCMNCM